MTIIVPSISTEEGLGLSSLWLPTRWLFHRFDDWSACSRRRDEAKTNEVTRMKPKTDTFSQHKPRVPLALTIPGRPADTRGHPGIEIGSALFLLSHVVRILSEVWASPLSCSLLASERAAWKPLPPLCQSVRATDSNTRWRCCFLALSLMITI